jgi:hypothetical protein
VNDDDHIDSNDYSGSYRAVGNNKIRAQGGGLANFGSNDVLWIRELRASGPSARVLAFLLSGKAITNVYAIIEFIVSKVVFSHG